MEARRDPGPEGLREERRRSEALRAAGVVMALSNIYSDEQVVGDWEW